MQCVNCGFENIPGIVACARCQSLLAFGDVGVAPPRRRGWGWSTRVRRAWNAVRQRFADAVGQLRQGWRIPETSDWTRAITANIVPGLGAILSGPALRGWVILGCWAAMLLATLAAIATPYLSAFAAALAVVHTIAILSSLRGTPDLGGFGSRALAALLLFTVIRWGAYGAATQLAARMYVPLAIDGVLPSGPIMDGDGILYQGSWLRPAAFRRGDLVIYQLDSWAAGFPLGYGTMVRDGLAIDRVVGVPGDLVHVAADGVFANGIRAGTEGLPLGPSHRFAGLTLQLGKEEYAVLPSRVHLVIYGGVDLLPVVERLARVRSENVLGRVIVRLHPWSRFGRPN